jgi:hypothetical protein
MSHVKRIMILPVPTKYLGVALSIFSVFPAFERSTIKVWTEVEGTITWLERVLAYISEPSLRS